MIKNDNSLILLYRIIYSVIGWIAIVVNYIFEINGVHQSYGLVQGALSTLKLFTIQTNIMVLIWSTCSIIYTLTGNNKFLIPTNIRGAVAVYISITGIIFFLFLEPVYGTTGYRHYIHVITHYIIPFAYIIDWLLTEERKTYKWKYIIYWNIYPIVYYLGYLLYGFFTDKYPYVFIDLNALGLHRFILNAFLCLLFFIFLSALYISINRFSWVSRRKRY
ncbi:putative membrane protein [Gottschalkia acidurici 9a]|uniref:Membrane protein n=1 Tax=Gottschalkia acidurici (strain ATCC 7906 / DSM 604 / BCRC 14475 / CIP 104303 / KCTC 5404 / NCIMB 10678 / 9a) TaxID=1128398 RepID=K0B464_GOTA9|nr:Pr6Pr family membrane protein [Gottschalkia acidurici]AFS79735.1 putative membrane protein [Gottschalkia acidurici 9a]